MTILGIDPGLATTGYGIIERDTARKWNIKNYGIIETKKTESVGDRLFTIHTDLTKLLTRFRPDAVGIEKLFFVKNQKTVMEVGQARGVILFTCYRAGCQIFEPTPLQVKHLLTGYGTAPKKQIQMMIQRLFLLPRPPHPDDAADALAVAHYAAIHAQLAQKR